MLLLLLEIEEGYCLVRREIAITDPPQIVAEVICRAASLDRSPSFQPLCEELLEHRRREQEPELR